MAALVCFNLTSKYKTSRSKCDANDLFRGRKEQVELLPDAERAIWRGFIVNKVKSPKLETIILTENCDDVQPDESDIGKDLKTSLGARTETRPIYRSFYQVFCGNNLAAKVLKEKQEATKYLRH